jgi:hypothetical protein
MEGVHSYETLELTYQFVRRHSPGHNNMNLHQRRNLKSHTLEKILSCIKHARCSLQHSIRSCNNIQFYRQCSG